jgi:hypothetical protein
MDFPLAVFSKKTWSFAPNTSLPDILDDLFLLPLSRASGSSA